MSIRAVELIARVSTEGVSTSSAQFAAMGAVVHATEGVFKSLANGFGDIKFGLANLATPGTIGMESIRMGAVQAGGALLKIAAIATLVGAAVGLAIGVISVKAAADFQVAVNRLRTGAGDTQDSFARLSSGILKVSTDTGVLSGPLSQAMYLILSSGQRGAQAFATLAAAAKGAVIEQANVKDVANTLSGVMTNYGTKVFSASQYMNGLVKAVSLGKITLQDLAVAMGPIDPIAQHLGVHFSDLAAAMTTQTNAMIPAHIAATGLRFLMQSMENPTKKMATAMKDMGLDTVAVANEMKTSLPNALEMVYNAAKKAGPEGSVPFNRAVADMVGGIRSTTAFMGLTGPHFAAFRANVQQIAGAMKSGAGDITGWSLVQGNFNTVMNRGHAALDALAITIGQALLPGLTKAMGVIVPLIVQFTQWLVKSGALQNTITFLGNAFNVLGTIVGGIVHFFQQNEVAAAALKATLLLAAGIIGGVLVIALVAATAAAVGFAVALLLNPITWIVIAIIAAITGIILIVQHWGQITAWLGSVWAAFASWFMGLWNGILSWIGGVFSSMGTKIRDSLTGIKNTVGGAFSAMGSVAHDKLTDLKNTVGGIFSGLGSTVHGKITDIKNFVVTGWQDMYNHNYIVKQTTDDVGKHFQELGTLTRNVFTGIKNVTGTTFDWIGTFIRDRFTWINNSFGWFFSQVGAKTHDGLTFLKNLFGSIFSAIGTFVRDRLTWIYNSVGWFFGIVGSFASQKLTDLKNMFGNAFQGIGTIIHQKMTDAWNGLVSFVSGWPAQAFNWGVNFVQGLINGIGSMFSALGSAVSNLAGQFGKLLGFHSPPPEGPARDSDKWMPNFINMLVRDLTAGQGKMKTALSGLMSPLAATTHLSATSSISGSAAGLSGSVARYGLTSSGGQSGTTIVVQPPDIYLDGMKLSHGLLPYITNQIRFGSNTIGR